MLERERKRKRQREREREREMRESCVKCMGLYLCNCREDGGDGSQMGQGI
jgi:hypothetical protein